MVLLSACSFIGVRGPTSRGVECTSRRTAPYVDTVVAVGALIGTTTALISASKNCDQNPGEEPRMCFSRLVGAMVLLTGLPYAFSAAYGHSTVSSCRRFRATNDASYLR